MGILKILVLTLAVLLQKDNSMQAAKVKVPTSDIPSCIKSLISKPAISLENFKLLSENFRQTISGLPKTPQFFNIQQFKTDVQDLFNAPNFEAKGTQIEEMIRNRVTRVWEYFLGWKKWFDAIKMEIVDKIVKDIMQVNGEVRKFFRNHFKEYTNFCTPDAARCRDQIEANVKIHNKKLSKNMKACQRFAKRQLDQHESMINKEKTQLEKPLLAAERCFDGKGSLVSCIGNMLSNVISKLAAAAKKFADAMNFAANNLQNNMNRFRECVVDRKNLLDVGRTKLIEAAEACLKPEA